MTPIDESGMMRFSRQLVIVVRNGRSLSSLVGSILFRVSLIHHEDGTASPRVADRHVLLVLVLPVVGLLELAAVALVDALRDPVRLELRLSSWATGGPPRIEVDDSRINMYSNPSPLFSSFRPVIVHGPCQR